MFSNSRLGREEKSIGEEKGVLARFVFYSPIFRNSKKRRINMKKVFYLALVLAFVFMSAMPVAAGGGPQPKPKFELGVCYVMNGDSVVGAKFGYMAEDMPSSPDVDENKITHDYALPFEAPPVGTNSDWIWSALYALPTHGHEIKWEVDIDDAGKHDAVIKHNPSHDDLENLCPAVAAEPFVGYSIPYLLLYKSAELINGYGVIVSSQPFVSVERMLAVFKLAAVPADLTQVCVGAVYQMYPSDTQGTWDCDPMLVGILASGKNGGRLPLISETDPSLQKVYEGILAWLK
jgi:hypothetical protein